MLHNQNTQWLKNESEIWKNWYPKRGEVYVIDLGEEGIGSEQKGQRPAVILSNNLNNKYSEIIQIAPITSAKKTNLPVHVKLDIKNGLRTESLVCLEQTRCVSKKRGLINGNLIRICQLNNKKIEEIDLAIKIQFSLSCSL